MELEDLSIVEKAAMLSGGSEWDSRGNDRADIPGFVMSDGPHGVRRQLGEGDHLGIGASKPATCFPTACTVANTWDPALAEEMGEALGKEAHDLDVNVLLGPGMNIKRNPLCGRNFEYYSEDGVLAGKLAAAQVNAMATKGTYNYIKHFALNDQETNRCAFLLTYSNEQAIREIYLKPFELCIKNFDGTQIAVMSSFNWIGTVPACANEDTLTTILRNEWGFQGMVITDYDGSYGYMITDHCVRTGNDLMLGFSSQASNQLTNTESATLNNALRTSCKNIMYTIANSGYYTNTTDDGGMSNMTKLFVTIDVVTVLLVVLCMALVIVRYRKKHAKTTAEVTPEEKKEE